MKLLGYLSMVIVAPYAVFVWLREERRQRRGR